MKRILGFAKKHYPVILIVLFSTIFVLPFLILYTNGHDTYFHAATINAIRHTFESGNILYPRVLPLVANDFGYATMIFYGPIAHFLTAIISSIIHFIGIDSVFSAMKIVHYISILLSTLFMYLFVKRVSNNKNVALVSSVIYMTFPYRLCEIYIRDAYAESLAFIFIPLIFWGLYELLNTKEYKKFYILFVIGTSGIILTHNITALFTCGIIGLYLLLNIKKVLKKEVIKRLIISGLFIFGITSLYTLPVVEQKLFGNINIFNNGLSSASWVSTYAISLKQLLPFIGKKSMDGIQFHILAIVWILIIASIIYMISCKVKKDRKIDNNINYISYLILGLVTLFCVTKLFPWEKMNGFILYIQFPWRLLVFAIFFLSIIASFIVFFIKDKKVQTITTIILCLVIFSSGVISLNKERLARNESFAQIDLRWYGLGAINDYVPVKTVENIEYFNTRNQDVIVESGKATITNIYKETPYIEFQVNQDLDEVSKIELPLLYYRGYKVVSTLDNDSDIEMYENSKGFIELKVKGPQKVVVNYVGTKVMKYSLYLSLIVIVAYVVFIYKMEDTNNDRKVKKD